MSNLPDTGRGFLGSGLYSSPVLFGGNGISGHRSAEIQRLII